MQRGRPKEGEGEEVGRERGRRRGRERGRSLNRYVNMVKATYYCHHDYGLTKYLNNFISELH